MSTKTRKSSNKNTWILFKEVHKFTVIQHRGVYIYTPNGVHVYLRFKPYSGLFSRRLYFANFARAYAAYPLKLKSWKIINVEEARFSISICELFVNKNWIGCMFDKRLENNPLYVTPYTIARV